MTCTKKKMSRENNALTIIDSAIWGNNCYPINFNYMEKTNTAWEKKQDVCMLSAENYAKFNLCSVKDWACSVSAQEGFSS